MRSATHPRISLFYTAEWVPCLGCHVCLISFSNWKTHPHPPCNLFQFGRALSKEQVLKPNLSINKCLKHPSGQQNFTRVCTLPFSLPDHFLSNSFLCGQCIYIGKNTMAQIILWNPRISDQLTISMRQQCWILIKNYTAWYITYKTYKTTSKNKDQVIIEPIDSWKEKCFRNCCL